MRLGLPRFLKPFVLATLMLVVGVAGLEVWLRVEDSRARRVARPEVRGDGLVVPSWTVHHELKPLRQVEFLNPDDQSRVEVRTNSFGLRGREPIVPKPPELFRILCLGDETTLGPDVEEAATAAHRLGELLTTRSDRPIEVLNAGVPGDCPMLAYLRMRHSLAALRPDVVIVAFDMGDVADDYRLRRHVEVADGIVPVACPSPLLRRLESKVDEPPEPFLLPAWLKQHASDWWAADAPPANDRSIDSPRGRYAWLRPDGDNWGVYVEQTFSSFEHLKTVCDEIGCRLVVAVHPAPWQVSARACCPDLRTALGVGETDFYRDREPFDRLGRFLAERGIAYCDGSEAFRRAEQPETLYLVHAPRFSRAGHDLHARVLATYLLHRVEGPWNAPSAQPSNPGVPPPRQARRDP